MLEFEPATILFTVINLLVLYLILRKLLFGRVNAVLEQRSALVKGKIAAAEDNNRQAEERKLQYERQLTDARQEGAKIVADAQKAGAAAVEAARRQARDQVSQWLAEAEELGREETARTLAANDRACQAMCQQARTRLDEAAELIVRRVVDS